MTIRELFINWLTASRFIQSLELRYAEQRNDFQERLGEKDALIRILRTENASLKLECDRMRSVLMPFGSPAGAIYAQTFQTGVKPPQVPAFTGPDDWAAELQKEYAKEKDGIPEQRREAVHEQAADETA